MIFSIRMDRIKASGIRAVQKRIAGSTNIISFAAGLPDPQLYPIEDLKKATDAMIEQEGKKAFSYGLTKGNGELLDIIVERMNNKEGVKCTKENVCMLSGSQQGLGLAALMFIDEGDVVVTENPSYLGAINAFRPFGAEFAGVDTDDDGIVIEHLEEVLSNTPKVKLIYVIPNFQNPTGKAWTLERRQRFMEVVSKHDVVVIEDNPYGEIRFRNEPLPNLKSLDTKGQVVYLGSFSKILSPGMRVAWMCAEPKVASMAEALKETNDLQSPEITQMIVAYYMKMFDLEAHIKGIQEVYKHRADLMIEMIEEHFPKEIKYTRPEGGMFLWLELPEGLDSDKILDDAIAAGVAYIPGESFFAHEGVKNTVRMNFTLVTDEQICEGIKILGEVFKKYI